QGLIDGRTRGSLAIDHDAGFDSLLVEQAVWLIVNAQPGLYVSPQVGIGATGVAQVVGAVQRIGLLDRCQENLARGFDKRGHGHVLMLLLHEPVRRSSPHGLRKKAKKDYWSPRPSRSRSRKLARA